MKFIGTLIVVNDCKKAFKFYNELFGLTLIKDNDGNMELSNGLFLQEAKYFKSFINKDIIQFNCSTELYFEEENLDKFIVKLENLYPSTKYVNYLMKHSWGQRVIRFFDLDGNLIEVGEPFIV